MPNAKIKIPLSVTTGFSKSLANPHQKTFKTPDKKPGPQEIVIDSGWSIVVLKDSPELVKLAAFDFMEYLNGCMHTGVTLRLTDDCKPGKKTIFISCDRNYFRGKEEAVPDSYAILVNSNGVQVKGYDERGAMHGTYFLEHLMNLRQGPVLKKEKIRRSAIFNPRIGITVFEKVWEDLADPNVYRDGYLSYMSHFGLNGVHLYIDMYEYVRSNIIPELKRPDAAKKLKILNDFTERAAKYGIDVYLTMQTPCRNVDHPVFKKHPQFKGATQFYEDGHIRSLCTSHPRVMEFMEDTCADFFRAVPKLKGFIVLVGGEGFLHCYTRPTPRPGGPGTTNCPRCAGRSPEKVISELMNNVAKAIKKVKKDAIVMAWPYSAHCWSKEKYQEKFIGMLSKDVSLLTEFEKDEVIKKGKLVKAIWDYSIDFIGPSKRFVAQSKAARKHGLNMYAKTETTVSLEIFNVPYNPVMYRWYERIKQMAEQKTDGLLECWKFYGFLGSIPEEISYWYSWKPSPGINGLLSKIAARDFGEKSVAYCLKAWKYFSRAMDYSPRIYGYFFGPPFMGPAHPLILEPDKTSGLSKMFFSWQNFLDELEGNVPHKEKKGFFKPLFATDLSWTGGEEGYRVEILGFQQKFLNEWSRGIKLLESAMKTVPADRRLNLEREFGIAKTIYSIFYSTVSVASFYHFRDKLKTCPSSGCGKIINKMIAIAKKEKANAQEALKFTKKDYRLGYAYTYEVPFTSEMIEAKIKQVGEVICKMKGMR